MNSRIFIRRKIFKELNKLNKSQKDSSKKSILLKITSKANQ